MQTHPKTPRARQTKTKANSLRKIRKTTRLSQPTVLRPDYRIGGSDKRPKSLKPIGGNKHIPDKKLDDLIILFASSQKLFVGSPTVTKEELASHFQVSLKDVDRSLRRLNRQGKCSQKRRNFAHDTNRNPMFPGPTAGWAANIYYITK